MVGYDDAAIQKTKGLKKENLRDNMSTVEIVLNMLAEATTTELSKVHQPQGFEESKEIAKRGGSYAGETRKSIESDDYHLPKCGAVKRRCNGHD